MIEKKIFYLCDRKKCENCNSECKHTQDITHAVNFKKEGCDFIEIEKTIIIKVNITKLNKKIRKILKENVEFELKENE